MAFHAVKKLVAPDAWDNITRYPIRPRASAEASDV